MRFQSLVVVGVTASSVAATWYPPPDGAVPTSYRGISGSLPGVSGSIGPNGYVLPFQCNSPCNSNVHLAYATVSLVSGAAYSSTVAPLLATRAFQVL
jgi:hypothetical protein